MKLILPMALLLSGCAGFAEISEKQQDFELVNNTAEVRHAEREICRQGRIDVLLNQYEGRLDAWAAFCNHLEVSPFD